MRVIILLLRDSPAGSQHEISVLVPVVNGRHQTQDDLKTHRMPKRQKCAGGEKRRRVGSGPSLAVNGQDPMGKRRLPVRCFCKLLNAGKFPWFKCHNIRNRRRQSFFQITNRLQSRSLFHIIQIHGLKKHAGVSLLFGAGYLVAVITVTHRFQEHARILLPGSQDLFCILRSPNQQGQGAQSRPKRHLLRLRMRVLQTDKRFLKRRRMDAILIACQRLPGGGTAHRRKQADQPPQLLCPVLFQKPSYIVRIRLHPVNGRSQILMLRLFQEFRIFCVVHMQILPGNFSVCF